MKSSTGGCAFMSRNAGRGERRVLCVIVRRELRASHVYLLIFFFCMFSVWGWSQDQQNPPGQGPPQNQSPEGQEQSQQPATPPANTEQKSTNPQEQGPENKPAENKTDEGSNPAQAAAQKTKDVTVQAAEATRAAAEQGLLHLRDWEQGWLTGVYVPKGQLMTPLTGEERRQIFLIQTLTSPGAYLKRMFAAGIDQARGAPSQWDDGWGGYSERFASREGQFISANTLAALANGKLRYEPRYDQCQCRGFWPRSRHAIIRNLLTYNSTEHELRPQWGLYGGSFAGGLISTAWKPHPRNAFAEGGRAMLGQVGYGALLNFFTEFASDINRKLGSKK